MKVWQKRYPWTKPWSHQQKEPSTNWWTPGNRTTTKRSSNSPRTSEWIGQPCWRISLVWKLNPWRTWRWISLISMVTWCLTSTAWRGQWRRWSWRHLSLRISRVSLKLYRTWTLHAVRSRMTSKHCRVIQRSCRAGRVQVACRDKWKKSCKISSSSKRWSQNGSCSSNQPCHTLKPSSCTLLFSRNGYKLSIRRSQVCPCNLCPRLLKNPSSKSRLCWTNFPKKNQIWKNWRKPRVSWPNCRTNPPSVSWRHACTRSMTRIWL